MPPKKHLIIFIVYIFMAISLFFLSSSSLAEAQSSFNDRFFFIKKQFIWAILGTISMIVASKIDLNFIKKIASPFYLISLTLLAIVLIPGVSTTIFGARRWLSFGFFAIQPTEIFKFAAIIYFSKILSLPAAKSTKNILIALGLGITLILLQPNMSSAILTTAIIASTYYLANGNIFHLTTLSLVGVVLGIMLIIVSPYRHARLQTLLSPESNTQITGYHTNQIIVSLSSGGLFGKGLGNSSQKYQYLPQLATDSILAVIGEELGFFGIGLIITLYYLLVTQIFKISKITTDHFEQLLICSIGFWIAYQTIINTAAVSILIPLTGIPLPFVSYGGSSLITLFAAIGLVANIQMKYTQTGETTKNHHHHRITPHPSHRAHQSAKK